MRKPDLVKAVTFAGVLAHVVLLPCAAQTPLNVDGITDRSYGSYADRATFRVPSSTGYSYRVLLDTNPVPTDVWVTVNSIDYHELTVWRTNLQTSEVTNRVVRFIVHNSARRAGGSTEDGIPSWTLYPTINSSSDEFAGAHLRTIAPESFPAGYPIPLVAWVENAQGHAVRVNGLLDIAGQGSFAVKRGVGSGFLAATNPAGSLVVNPQVGGLSDAKTINLESSPAWTTVSGLLPANTVWPAGSRIHITGNLTNPAGSTLTIGAGTIVRINPSTDIGNNGSIVINGTTAQPVVFMPATVGQPWGGFIQHANNTSFSATGAIFTGAGAYQGCWFTGHGCSSSLSGIGSHRGEQALISLRGQNCNLTLTDCAAIYLAGQFSHSASGSYSYVITLTHFLLQRCTTGGEFTGARFNVNDSAFIECDEDLTVGESPEYEDGDNDGLYIVNAVNGAHAFTNTLWGWTKDDGVDSGGSGAGQLNFQRCWFEGILHEGNSLSGTGKDSRHFDDVFINCGQGIEDGYDSPTGRVDRCLLINNLIGVRFGDNYDWTYGGFQWATNSISINNHRDVWGMNWQAGTSGWIYRTNQMNIQSNLFSMPTPLHPFNNLWNPATDAWRLTNYLTIPPTARVGIGFAVWSNQWAMTNLFPGVPVRLSSFTTNYVTAEYTWENGNGVLAFGTLTFAPGETLKRIVPAGFNAAGETSVRLWLQNPVNAELTGETNLVFQGTAPAVQMAFWVGTNAPQTDLARVGEGIPVMLSASSAQTVTAEYTLEFSGQTVANGTVTFLPGQTAQWIALPGVNPVDYSLLRLTLRNPSGAGVMGSSSFYLVTTPPAPPLPPATMLVASNSLWRYLDTGGDAGTAWRQLGYNDSTWSNNFAQLGFGDQDERTPIRRVGTNGTQSTTYYFRQTFVVTNPADFASLSLWLLRDDGGVVYLNGTEAYRSPTMPQAPTPITYQTWATNQSIANAPPDNTVDTATLSAGLLVTGTNLLAVEIHQHDSGSSDVSFDCALAGNSVPPIGSRPFIYWGQFDRTNLVLAWSDATYRLESASAIDGPWTNAAPASPFTVESSGAQQFHRLRR